MKTFTGNIHEFVGRIVPDSIRRRIQIILTHDEVDPIDQFIVEATTRKSNRIDEQFTQHLREKILPVINSRHPVPGMLVIFGVKQNRGRAYLKQRRITIPIWTNKPNEPGYIIWYLAHEISHIAQFIQDGFCDNHGPRFMNWLKLHCPEEYWHYETLYKPRNTAAAGISRDQQRNILSKYEDL